MLPESLATRYSHVETIHTKEDTVLLKAKHIELNRFHCIKIYRVDEADLGALQDWKKEAQSLARFDSYNVVQVHDAGHFVDKHGDGYYIIMDWIDGYDLRRLMHEHLRRPLSAPEVVEWSWRIARVLAYAHDRIGFIHRDIKPENLMFQQKGLSLHVRLIDFGAGFLKRRRQGDDAWVGTPGYVAPEAAYAPPSPKLDVYSLGVTMWESLTMQSFSQVGLTSDGKALSPREAAPNTTIPPALERLVLQMLEPDPDNRPTMREVADSLRDMGRLLLNWDEDPIAGEELPFGGDRQLVESLLNVDGRDPQLHLALARILAQNSPSQALGAVQRGLEACPDSVELVNLGMRLALDLDLPQEAVKLGLAYCTRWKGNLTGGSPALPFQVNATSSIGAGELAALTDACTLSGPPLDTGLLGLALFRHEAPRQATILTLTHDIYHNGGRLGSAVTLMDCFLRDGKPDEVVSLDKTLPAWLRSNPQIRLRVGQAHLLLATNGPGVNQEANLKRAANIARELRKAHPDNPEVILLADKVARATGKLHEALDVWLRARELNIVELPVDLRLAELYVQLEAWPQAEVAAHQHLNKEPGNLEARSLLGQALLKAGRPEEALVELEAARAEGLIDSNVLWALGEAYLAMGNPAEAAAALSAGLLKHLGWEDWPSQRHPLGGESLSRFNRLLEVLLEAGQAEQALSLTKSVLPAADEQSRTKEVLRFHAIRALILERQGLHAEAFKIASPLVRAGYQLLPALEAASLSALALGMRALPYVLAWAKATAKETGRLIPLGPVILAYESEGHHERVIELHRELQKLQGYWNVDSQVPAAVARSILARPDLGRIRDVLEVSQQLAKPGAPAEHLALAVELLSTKGITGDRIVAILKQASGENKSLRLSPTARSAVMECGFPEIHHLLEEANGASRTGSPEVSRNAPRTIIKQPWLKRLADLVAQVLRAFRRQTSPADTAGPATTGLYYLNSTGALSVLQLPVHKQAPKQSKVVPAGEGQLQKLRVSAETIREKYGLPPIGPGLSHEDPEKKSS